MKTTLAVTTSDAAFMLHYNLGPVRDWTQTLEDMRGKEKNYLKMSIKPFGKLKVCRSYRPAYRVSEVHNFIEEARLRSGITLPVAAVPSDKIAPQLVEDDPANTAHWKVRKLTPYTAA